MHRTRGLATFLCPDGPVPDASRLLRHPAREQGGSPRCSDAASDSGLSRAPNRALPGGAARRPPIRIDGESALRAIMATPRGSFSRGRSASQSASYDAGEKDLATLRQPVRLFGTRLSPMSSVRSVTYGSGLDIEVANPAGLEPATNSLEGPWSCNDFNAIL